MPRSRSLWGERSSRTFSRDGGDPARRAGAAPRELRLPLAHLLREAGAGLRRGMPLPFRLHVAFGELLVGLDDFAAGLVDPIDYP